jgi:D-alanyl-D-alanine carboxypeptidase/D-alanyl-D-alanine-endopeptidase (penicillin-binding protein 4)
MKRQAALLAGALALSLCAAAGPSFALEPPVSAPPASTSAPIPTEQGISASIKKLASSRALGDSGAVVIDGATGTVLYGSDSEQALVPASTTKMLTAAAVLESLGPTTRITTPARRLGDTIYLIGAGDPTLRSTKVKRPKPDSPATLADLAAQIDGALGTDPTIDLVFDDSLFSGKELGPGWKSSYPALGISAPISALMVDGARKNPKGRARVADPAQQAARTLAKQLRALGVKVTSVKPGTAPSIARTIASVQSAPISTMVESMLTDSDNTYAEMLGHLVGVKEGSGGTFAGAALATEAILADAGIEDVGLDLYDASGLSPKNRISPETLAAVLTDVAQGAKPSWAAIATGLAIGGKTGTLKTRFRSESTKAGRGVVHAKTGTLTGVSSLAGWTTDEDRRLLVFAVIANKVSSLAKARNTIDRIASRLSECGCS